MNAYASKYQKEDDIDFLVDTTLSGISTCSSGIGIFYSGGFSFPIMYVGLAADATSAVRKSGPAQLPPDVVGRAGKPGKIASFFGPLYNWYRGLSGDNE